MGTAQVGAHGIGRRRANCSVNPRPRVALTAAVAHDGAGVTPHLVHGVAGLAARRHKGDPVPFGELLALVGLNLPLIHEVALGRNDDRREPAACLGHNLPHPDLEGVERRLFPPPVDESGDLY